MYIIHQCALCITNYGNHVSVSQYRNLWAWNLLLTCSSLYPCNHSLGEGGIYRNRPVCPDQLPHLFSDFHQTLWNLRSWCVNFAVHWVLPLLCLFGHRNFETIQYALCHRKFSYMINQKFMKLCTLQDVHISRIYRI